MGDRRLLIILLVYFKINSHFSILQVNRRRDTTKLLGDNHMHRLYAYELDTFPICHWPSVYARDEIGRGNSGTKSTARVCGISAERFENRTRTGSRNKTAFP